MFITADEARKLKEVSSCLTGPTKLFAARLGLGEASSLPIFPEVKKAHEIRAWLVVMRKIAAYERPVSMKCARETSESLA